MCVPREYILCEMTVGKQSILSGDIEDPREEAWFLGILDEFCRQLLLIRFYIAVPTKPRKVC